MNFRRIIGFIVAFLLISIISILYILQYNIAQPALDMVAVNDIAQSLAEGWDSLKDGELPPLNYNMDYVVLDSENHFIKATRRGLSETLNSAIRNRDTIIDIKSNNTVLGKLIIYNDLNIIWQHNKNLFAFFSLVIVAAAAIFSIIYLIYIDRTFLRPFRKLQDFARHVAEGNLDMPLVMDKGNLFGAFTESFDLMRDELYKARENERRSNQSKKELVASLSHDIKTPVASIKAVAEVLQIKSGDKYQKEQLAVIDLKADQINSLITNMFNATLEELQELKVTVTEHSSQILCDIIKNADYQKRASIGYIPGCIIKADPLRLAQVIDNILNNSYKYAGTPIEVGAFIEEQYLEVIFKDYGSGVPENELPLIFNKFYRAGNSACKSGTGLGLYISKFLMCGMSGDIECENEKDGFIVRMKLRIA